MSKKRIRQDMIEQLNSLDQKEKIAIEHEMYNHLFTSNLWKEANVIGITWSIGIEWNTEPIIKRAWNENKFICIPKSYHDTKQMDFFYIKHKKDLELGYAGIMEPRIEKSKKVSKNSIELLIVPGIAFNHLGYRIGFGGGFYDRFLTDFTQNTLSLVSKIQLTSFEFSEPHDIPIKFMVTEDGVLKIRNK